MLDWLSAIGGAIIGLALIALLHFMIGMEIKPLQLLVFGGIGMAVSVAISLGRRNGLRKAEFGKEGGNSFNG